MIVVNINKAKTIAHGLRRSARAQEFEPWDKIISAQIPGTDPVDAEQSRQAIREKYAMIQTQIDECDNVQSLKLILDSM